MSKKTKAQFAIEFMVLIAFMFLVFLGFTAIITSRIIDAKDAERQQIAEDIATLAKNEIELAKTVSDGYIRSFDLPTKINGNTYTIEIIDNRELVVNYLDKEYVTFLPERICGDIYLPNNEIGKEENFVCVNSNLDQIQCQNAQDLSLCGTLDEDLLPGTRCCCCNRYSLCCP